MSPLLKHLRGYNIIQRCIITGASCFNMTRNWTQIRAKTCIDRNRCHSIISRIQLWTRSLSTTAQHSTAKSQHSVISIPDNLSFHEFLMARCEEFGDTIALRDGQTGHCYTYNQLKDKSIRVASGLKKMGFEKGDILCLYSYNIPEYAVVILAVTSVGGIVSCANPLYTVDELTHQVKLTGSKMLVTVPVGVHTALMVKERCQSLKNVLVIGEEAEGCRPFSDLLEDDGSAYPSNLCINPKEDLMALPFSSGTTGLPKGVMLTHYNIIANLHQIMFSEGLNAIHGKDVWIGVLPFFHIYGNVVTLLIGLSQGVTIVTLPKFEPEVYLDCIQKYRATFLHLVPPIVLLMAKHPMMSNYDLSSIESIITAAAPCQTKLAEEFMDRTKIKSFRQGYGLTETSPITHLSPWNNKHLGSIGQAVPNTECKIINPETGETLGPNEAGELLVRGPQVMKGYLNNEEATKKSINEDGWFLTGDVVHYLDDGYFFITDRIKELIKYKGFQVPPAELEGILLTHPSIQDAAVVGIPDDEAGELPRAYVVLKSKMELSETEILEYVNVKVAPSKKLRAGVKFVDQIPKTASGKILRRQLKTKT